MEPNTPVATLVCGSHNPNDKDYDPFSIGRLCFCEGMVLRKFGDGTYLVEGRYTERSGSSRPAVMRFEPEYLRAR